MKKKNVPNFSDLLEQAILTAEENGMTLRKDQLIDLSKSIEQKIFKTPIIRLVNSTQYSRVSAR